MMNKYKLTHLNKPFINFVNNNDDNYTKYLAEIFNNAKGIFCRAKIKTMDRLRSPKLISITRRGHGDRRRSPKVVVKISKNKEMLEKDYNASIILSQLKCSNFAKYYGFFSCKDDLNSFEKNKILPKKFCLKNGTTNYYIFMAYFPLGSLENYLPKNVDELKSIVNQIIAASILANEKFGFIHNDLHHGNILVRKTTKKQLTYNFNDRVKTINTYGIEIVMFDFDRSEFNCDYSRLLLQLNAFFNIYNYFISNKNKPINKDDPLKYTLKELQKITTLDMLKEFIGDE